MLVALLMVGCGQPGESGKAPAGGTGSSGGSADSSGDLKNLAGAIDINGSSTLFLVTEAAAEAFADAGAGTVNINLGIAGTGGGFKKFCNGEIDICDASRPILTEEMKIARDNKIEYIEIPVCFDALTVAVHPSNKLESITVAELKKMWEPAAQDKILRWNQVSSNWPDAPLKLFGAGSDSGTFDYFTEAIVGKAKASRGDYTASEDDNSLVQGIAGTKDALGYLPFAYYVNNKNKLKALAIDWEKGEGPVPPSLENVVAGKYNPLSRPLFLYVNRKSAERPEVKAFVEFYLKNGAKLANKVHYLPLPEQAYAMGRERFEKLKTGSGFGGVPEVGLPVEEILKREPKQ
jgi:phosphate transport system substrate-binding protein